MRSFRNYFFLTMYGLTRRRKKKKKDKGINSPPFDSPLENASGIYRHWSNNNDICRRPSMYLTSFPRIALLYEYTPSLINLFYLLQCILFDQNWHTKGLPRKPIRLSVDQRRNCSFIEVVETSLLLYLKKEKKWIERRESDILNIVTLFDICKTIFFSIY